MIHVIALYLIVYQLKFDIKCISQNPLKHQTTSRRSEQLVFATDISMNAANFHGVICDNVCEGYVDLQRYQAFGKSEPILLLSWNTN